MECELISVIVPVYNVKGYLPNCLRSIANQTYRNLEIILVDDGSTDGSDTLCDEFADSYKQVQVIHQENMGLWAARNAGQRAAHGEFLIFIDSDDYIHSDMISTLHKAINDTEGIDLAMVDYKKTTRLDEDIDSSLEGSAELLDQEEVLSRYCQGSIAGCIWNKLFRKSILEGLSANNYQRAQDQDFCIRTFLKAKRAVLVHKVMYFWVQHSGSIMHSSDYLFRFYHDIIDIYWGILSSLTDDSKRYESLFLKKLQRRLVLSKAYLYGTEHTTEVSGFCDVYKKKTSRRYWHCKDISLIEKTAMGILYRCPGLVYRYMKRTGNWSTINDLL